MTTIWKINIALAALVVVLYCVDEWFEFNLALGSRCSAERIVGMKEGELFDGQPVIPDWLEISPLEHRVRYRYARTRLLWRDYPRVEAVARDGVIEECSVNGVEARAQ